MTNSTRFFLAAMIGCTAMTVAAQTSDLPVLGGIYYGNEESGLSTMQYYSFNPSAELDFQQLTTALPSDPVSPSDAKPNSMAVCGNKVFMFFNYYDENWNSCAVFKVYDKTSGDLLTSNENFVCPADPNNKVNPVVNGATYNEKDGKVYLLHWGGSYNGYRKGILSIDPETYEVKEGATLSNAYLPLSISASPDGKDLYYIRGIEYVLAKIDIATGECTDVTSTKLLSDKSFNMNAAHGTSSTITSDGTMYIVSTDMDNNSFLLKTNITTGVGEFISDIPNQGRFFCMDVISEPSSDPTGVENVSVSHGTVTSGRGYIAAQGFVSNVEVYSLDGRKVASAAGEVNISVPAGVYVVRSGNTVVKTIVK